VKKIKRFFKEISWKVGTEASFYFINEYDFVHKKVILFSDYPYRKHYLFLSNWLKDVFLYYMWKYLYRITHLHWYVLFYLRELYITLEYKLTDKDVEF